MAGRGAVGDVRHLHDASSSFCSAASSMAGASALLAAVFSSFTVLHIQLSHFLTVDTFLTTFITLGMYFAIDIVRKGSLKAGLLMGVALGMAMGTKVSVAPLVPSIVVAWLVVGVARVKRPSIAARADTDQRRPRCPRLFLAC